MLKEDEFIVEISIVMFKNVVEKYQLDKPMLSVMILGMIEEYQLPIHISDKDLIDNFNLKILYEETISKLIKNDEVLYEILYGRLYHRLIGIFDVLKIKDLLIIDNIDFSTATLKIKGRIWK